MYLRNVFFSIKPVQNWDNTEKEIKMKGFPGYQPVSWTF